MLFHSTSLCFVCAHFAAGQNQHAERNADYAEITRKVSFPMGRSLNSHDYVFWCGDFNYRIDSCNDDVKDLIQAKEWQTLLLEDQLKKQQNEGKVFRKFLEGEIHFPPTYKYDINSEDYDTSEKCRVPAWTDRILFRKRYPTKIGEDIHSLNFGKILHYGRAELKTSDHRPVIGEFEIEVIKVDQELRSKVFQNVLEQLGPMDATVIVTLESVDGDESDVIFEDGLVTAILKRLATEAGEIVLARFGEGHLRITFRDGQCALNAAKLDVINIMHQNIKIQLKTPNWIEAVEEELKLGMNNTIPLVDKIIDHNEDELDESLGPEFDPTVFIVEDDEIDVNAGRISPASQQSNESSDSQEKEKPPPLPGRSTPTLPPPARPPPPQAINTTSRLGSPSRPPKPTQTYQPAKEVSFVF